MNREHYAKLAAEVEAMRQQQEKMPHPVDECGAGCSGLMAQSSAPKPWVDLSIEEKIERTRAEVKRLHEEMRYLHGRMSDVRRTARRMGNDLIEHRHLHEDGGKVMLPAGSGSGPKEVCFDDAENCNAAQEVDPSKLYF